MDWPPAPWRLLRALVAVAGTGLTSLPEPLDESISDTADDALPVSRLASVLALLAGPPKIWLPRTGGGHTRQFLPKASKPTGSAVFDSFVTVSKETPIVFEWPEVDLAAGDERFTDLQALLRRLTYFGRAESWCEACAHVSLPVAVKPDVSHWSCVALESGPKPGGLREHVDYTLERKLAPCFPLLESSHGSSLAEEATILLTRIKGADANENFVGVDSKNLFGNFPLSELTGRLEVRPNAAKKRESADDSDVSSSQPKTKKKPWILVAMGSWTELERDAFLKNPALKGHGMKAAKKALSDVLKKRTEATAENLVWKEELGRNGATSKGGLLLLRCLLRSSGEDIAYGLERPIGSRWLQYTVPRAIYRLPESTPRRAAGPPADGPRITLIRFALNTATINRAVLPSMTDTLLVADKFRSAALAWHGHLVESGQYPVATHPRNFCGREEDGSRVVGHDHAFFWPRDEDGDGLLDHVTVFCPRGLAADEVDSLRRLLRLKQRGGRPDLLVTPVFLGRHEQFWPQERVRTFISATPYFCPLHLTHGTGRSGRRRSVARYVLDSLRETLHLSDDTAAPAVEEIRYLPGESAPKLQDPDEPSLLGSLSGFWTDSDSRFIRALTFCRRRRNHEVKGPGKCFRITFAEPRPAEPFAIGDQSHFGLGLFVPDFTSPSSISLNTHKP